MKIEGLRELLCRRSLTSADINSIYYLMTQTTPAVARVLILLLLIDGGYVRDPKKKRKTRTPRRQRQIGAPIVKPGLGF